MASSNWDELKNFVAKGGGTLVDSLMIQDCWFSPQHWQLQHHQHDDGGRRRRRRRYNYLVYLLLVAASSALLSTCCSWRWRRAGLDGHIYSWILAGRSSAGGEELIPSFWRVFPDKKFVQVQYCDYEGFCVVGVLCKNWGICTLVKNFWFWATLFVFRKLLFIRIFVQTYNIGYTMQNFANLCGEWWNLQKCTKKAG